MRDVSEKGGQNVPPEQQPAPDETLHPAVEILPGATAAGKLVGKIDNVAASSTIRKISVTYTNFTMANRDADSVNVETSRFCLKSSMETSVN